MVWQGWIAALGGLISIIGFSAAAVSWMTWLGGIIAIIFGVWVSLAK